ncbi:hypothetical protein HUJ05_003454 [Dendroctonus ponderosae]|nr:hypothetical protein HUJ05_003454 [Dendroctonus ponderosae]
MGLMTVSLTSKSVHTDFLHSALISVNKTINRKRLRYQIGTISTKVVISCIFAAFLSPMTVQYWKFRE